MITMNQIEWCESHSVGVGSIDEQHKRLVALTNQLFMAIMRDEGGQELGEVLAELARYTEYHFSYEEQILTAHGYPEASLEEHRQEHCRLTGRVYELLDQYAQAPSTLDLEVYNFLRDWMTEHMSGTDSHYAAFLASKGVR